MSAKSARRPNARFSKKLNTTHRRHFWVRPKKVAKGGKLPSQALTSDKPAAYVKTLLRHAKVQGCR